MDLAQQFGIQPILLSAQAVNFLILVFLLQKFLYKPILKTMQERKDKIAQSLKDAESIERKLLMTEEDREKALANASDEAKDILDEATQTASQIIADAQEKAAKDIVGLVQKGRESISQERVQMQQEFREEVANLVTASLKQVSSKMLTKKDQREILSQTIKGV